MANPHWAGPVTDLPMDDPSEFRTKRSPNRQADAKARTTRLLMLRGSYHVAPFSAGLLARQVWPQHNFDRLQLAGLERVGRWGHAGCHSHLAVPNLRKISIWLLEMKSVLISGAGIAGPTLAFWLRAAGFEPTLIERAPGLRTGGYVIDFWGLGYDLAERMGLIAEIDRLGYRVRETRIVDADGRRIAGFGTRVLSELTGGRYVTLQRS